MGKIKLTQDYEALVDDTDFERVSEHKWYAKVERRADCSVRVYAVRNVPREGGGQMTQRLHRFIMDAPTDVQMDHINGDGLDNRRENLRVCTRSENQRNMRPRGGYSQYKGVTLFKRDAKWVARIWFDGKKIYLGKFDDEKAAAMAYDSAATNFFGPFARTNFKDAHNG